MSGPGTLSWFALHEARLNWRDWLSLMTAGHRRRIRNVILGFVAFALFLHGLAYLILSSSANLPGPDNRLLLAIITGSLVMAWSLMLSQAMESVTRAFYARGDLELILTSPVTVARLFAVRIAAIAVTIASMVLVLASPFINVLAWLGGAHWLGAYAAAIALTMVAVAVAVALTIALFHTIGPKRTRFISQIIAAVIGAAFAISIQFAAILSFGTITRMTALQAAVLDKLTLEEGSALWWPARAVLGEPIALATLLGLGFIVLAAAIHVFAPRFGQFALAAGNVSNTTTPPGRRLSRFRNSSPAQALRRKEWMLLLRDPWLMSQTLMQLLYLMPAAFLLWRNFYSGDSASTLLVPILIMAAGQLGGGLAWLAVSGEDASELIASAPVTASRVLRAKTEAVLGGIAMIFGPLVSLLAVGAPFAALVALVGVVIAAGSATADPILVSYTVKAHLFPAAPDLIADRHLCRGTVINWLGRYRRSGNDGNLACARPRGPGACDPCGRLDD
jgi:ABC-2 type transport system permease protein